MGENSYKWAKAHDVDHLISKANRYFDPEGDRQRRTGMLTGAGIGTGVAGAAVLSSRGKKGVLASAKYGKDEKILGFRPSMLKNKRNAIGMAMLVGGAGLGIGSARYGVSGRNRRYQ